MTELPSISYPAVIWHEGYIFLAKAPLELCAHPRGIFRETVRLARSGELQLVDVKGHRFAIVDWTRVPPFGGVKSIAYRLLLSVFAVPVLANETKLSLSEFRKTLARAIRSRYRYDSDKAEAVLAIRNLRTAHSFEAAIEALPRL